MSKPIIYSENISKREAEKAVKYLRQRGWDADLSESDSISMSGDIRDAGYIVMIRGLISDHKSAPGVIRPGKYKGKTARAALYQIGVMARRGFDARLEGNKATGYSIAIHTHYA